MKEGIIQQVDAPLQLYARPANRFVASFIGSPAMNFVSGSIHAGEFKFGDDALKVDATLPDGPAQLGLRPEHLEVLTTRSLTASSMSLNAWEMKPCPTWTRDTAFARRTDFARRTGRFVARFCSHWLGRAVELVGLQQRLPQSVKRMRWEARYSSLPDISRYVRSVD